jgi:excisionase family DNA binding protein
MSNVPNHLPKLQITDQNWSVTEVEWWPAKVAASYLGIKPRTLLLWVRQGKIPGYVLSGVKRRILRFLKKDLDTLLLERSSGVLCSASPSVLVTKGEGK